MPVTSIISSTKIMPEPGMVLLKSNNIVGTKDRSLSAQWEHTILVTKSGYEILTLRDEETDMPVLK
jgi:methionine aminopeptidase